jgi:hypothetical protein
MTRPAVEDSPPSRLRILCVGTGRDGTQSLYHMIQHLLDRSGGGQAMHEYCCREFYQAFCEWAETGDSSYDAALGRMVAACPYECIVGNGYAAVLPLFAARYGRGLTLVHLRRHDRKACIASLMQNCELFPTAYGNYSSSPAAVAKRMAAFHFGETSREAWDRLPLAEKFGWYYDKTHALIEHHAVLFDQCMKIETECLDEEETRQTIARLVTGREDAAPPRTRLNAARIDIASFPPEYQYRMAWLLGRLNLEEVARDEVYALDYFLDKFIAWTGYQITDAPQLAPARPAPVEKIEADLDRALRVVKSGLRALEALQQLLRARNDESRGGISCK